MTWIIFADDKYWLNTYYTYTGLVTDILDTLIIHELFARERVAFVLIICISTNTCDFRDFLRILYFFNFLMFAFKKESSHCSNLCCGLQNIAALWKKVYHHFSYYKKHNCLPRRQMIIFVTYRFWVNRKVWCRSI